MGRSTPDRVARERCLWLDCWLPNSELVGLPLPPVHTADGR